LVPFRANSSATLLALGADTIILGQQGELGPIDPSMTLSRLIGDPKQNQGTVTNGWRTRGASMVIPRP